MADAETYKPVDAGISLKNLKKIRDRGYESGADYNGKIHSYHPDQVDGRIDYLVATRVIKDKITLYENLMVNDPWFANNGAHAEILRNYCAQFQILLNEIKEACK